MDSKCVVPPTRPVKMRVSPFTAWIDALSSMNSAAVQLPRDIMPGRSIISPRLTPAKFPESMRTPAQVWQRSSVGGCSPKDSTHGQNTVQLHDSAISPLSVQFSATVSFPLAATVSSNRRARPMSCKRGKQKGDAAEDQAGAHHMAEGAAGANLLDRHHEA